MEKLLLRPAEAAEVMGIGRTKLFELLASNELPRVRVGRSVLVPTASIRDWIERQVRDNPRDNG